MNFQERRTLPPAEVGALDPATVFAYVEAKGWRHEPRLEGNVRVYDRPEDYREQLVFPKFRDLLDFVPAMTDALVWLAAWENRPALEVLQELLVRQQGDGAAPPTQSRAG
jgi:hypothetical protein